MDEITINYYLLIPTIISIMALGTIFYFRKKLFSKRKLLWTSLTVFFVVYLFVVGSAIYDDIYYQWNVNRYDLNKDGLFNGEEITNEQNLAMQKLINDVGRNFSFVTGFILAVAVSGAVYIIGQLKTRFVKIERNKNHTQQRV
jgi:hypothetical protein